MPGPTAPTTPHRAKHAELRDKGDLNTYQGNDFIIPKEGNNNYGTPSQSHEVSYAAAREWIRDGGVLQEGHGAPKQVRNFFTDALKGKMPEGKAVFDDKGHFTKEAAEAVGKMQEGDKIYKDGKIGRQTFNDLFDEKSHGVEGGYQTAIDDFGTAFYEGKDGHPNQTVKATQKDDKGNPIFDMNDDRAKTFKAGLIDIKKDLEDDKKTMYGRDGKPLSDAKVKHIRELAAKISDDPNSLTQKEVESFQGIMKEAGFKHGGQEIKPSGEINYATAQGMMNASLMNRTMNPAKDKQTILAMNKGPGAMV